MIKRTKRQPREYYLVDEVMSQGLQMLGNRIMLGEVFKPDGLYGEPGKQFQREEPAPIRFARLFSLNPTTYEHFHDEAEAIERSGFSHYGANAIIEFMRHHTNKNTDADAPNSYIDFYGEEKIGNPYKMAADLVTYFSRVYMCRNPGELIERSIVDVDGQRRKHVIPRRLFELHTIQYELEFDAWLSWMFEVENFRSRPEISEAAILTIQSEGKF
jgi:hypothetical protein